MSSAMRPSTSNKDAVLDAARHMGRLSKRLIFSYILDWVIILVFAAAGGALSVVSPRHRPFSLLNQEIAFPYVEESVPIWMLGVVCLIAPAGLIAIITLVFVPGAHARRTGSRAQTIRLKLWELEKGLAGLCLSLAVSFFVTQGAKNMFGKPRPNMLAHCLPDLNAIAEHTVGAYGGQDVTPSWVLVDHNICTQTDLEFLDDGFRSFPSGHSSWSWAGLLYLTLFLCSKFAIAIPHLPVVPASPAPRTRQPETDHELLPLHANRARGESMETKREFDDAAEAIVAADPLSVRNAAAAPPNYLILPALTPVAVAVWICSTRYAEFYHFGFDIISGSLIGIVSAYLAFRWYHLPISRGQGWAWGARSKSRAFAIGVGTGGYVGEEGWHNEKVAASSSDTTTRAWNPQQV